MECPHCNKKYKRENKLRQHVLLCGIDKKELNKVCLLPTNKEMWFIIQKLVKQNEVLQNKVNKLEDIINKDVKKLSMVDWLNENDKGINIDIWLKTQVNVTMDDLNLIFMTDYMRGLSNILTNNINPTENNPFRAFSHKVSQLYIYQNSKWKKVSKYDIVKIFDRISLNILKKSKEYDKSLNDNQKYGPDNMQYLKNCDKIMVVDTKKKERYFKYIENSIINIVKKNLNEMTKYKFYI